MFESFSAASFSRRGLRELIRLPLLRFERKWVISNQCSKNSAQSMADSVLLLSPDPSFLVGSKGDEAMTVGISAALFARGVKKVGIVTNLPSLPDSLAEIRITREGPWSLPWSLARIAQILTRYSGVVVIGADVMDGHYSPLSAARLWTVADLASRMGLRACVAGFSFNEEPSLRLLPILNSLSASVKIFSRDAVSQGRFNRFVSGSLRPELVADAAFLLKPRENGAVRNIAKWALERRAAGSMVVGFNIHPLLFKNSTADQRSGLVEVAIKSFRAVMSRRSISVVMIPHDYRGVGVGDVEILRDIYVGLNEYGERIMFPEQEFHASELKAIAGSMDLVITGRMHLAIASLGMGTPVAAMTYQGKFQGLFQHFGLSDEFLISPAQLAGEGALSAFVIRAIDAQQQLKAQVEHKLPEVLALAQKNVAPLVPSA